MATITGPVRVFEALDGGTGVPLNTTWGFFVGPQALNTRNPLIAEAMRLAIETAAEVQVDFDVATNTVERARIEYRYVCEQQSIQRCHDQGPYTFCEPRRYSNCDVDSNDPIG